MNVKRFTAPNSRDALKQVRLAFGRDAVVLSTRPCADGVEVLAMAPDAMHEFERVAVSASPQPEMSAQRELPAPAPARNTEKPGAWSRATAALRQRLDPSWDEDRAEPPAAQAARDDVDEDVQQLSMSTLSFQDYVRERMLRRRKQELEAARGTVGAANAPSAATEADAQSFDRSPAETASRAQASPASRTASAARRAPLDPVAAAATASNSAAPQGVHVMPPAAADPQAVLALARERSEMVNEIRSMKGLIEERFGALAFMEKLQRQPRQAHLSQKLLDSGFSPALTRKLVGSLPANTDESAWAASVLERNLQTAEREAALEDQGGVWALVGSTGVGKTTSTAKLAAAFASRHGAGHLGLITLDAYRMGAQEQLRAYGRILGVPVHTAHDRASLEDLLDLLAGKKMVLIDTAGIAQRDSRTAELMEMLSHPSIQRLLVVNASAQGETIEDVVKAYSPAACKGVVLTKVDEAVKLAPALDAMIRHRMKVVAVANGQRVPEDWHRLSSSTLVQRALRAAGTSAWRMDSSDVNLVFAGAQVANVADGAH
jgi:flagellar biosynthesis protein FlhF